jgi:hypothetical protein
MRTNTSTIITRQRVILWRDVSGLGHLPKKEKIEQVSAAVTALERPNEVFPQHRPFTNEEKKKKKKNID